MQDRIVDIHKVMKAINKQYQQLFGDKSYHTYTFPQVNNNVDNDINNYQTIINNK